MQGPIGRTWSMGTVLQLYFTYIVSLRTLIPINHSDASYNIQLLLTYSISHLDRIIAVCI